MQRFGFSLCQRENTGMKYFLLLVFLGVSLTLLNSCKKSDGNDNQSLPGKWELRYLQGGYILSIQTGNYPPGNGNIYQFTDNSYRYYSGSQLIDSGGYRITKDTISPFQKKMDKLTFINFSTQRSVFYEFADNNLIIYNGIIAADGTIATYSRL